ncbi:MAG TPA: patatin-like phospholipase family protein [Rhizomicrobium sp.]
MPQPNLGPRNAQDNIFILSIDGGGIRGILPARVIAEIERRTDRPAASLFHMISGTSTGGIIACGLASGHSASDLGNLYAQHGGEIFARSMWQRASNPAQLTGPKYQPDNLEAILRSTLGNALLGDIRSTEILIPTYAIQLFEEEENDGVASSRKPMFFKSWKARSVGLAPGEKPEQFNFLLRDVARATSAAPTYFPPANVTNSAGESFGVVDGGVFANNPSLCALSAASVLYPGATYTVVSLGTGSLERRIPYAEARSWGDLNWLHPILSILMDGNADTVCYQCDQLLGGRHKRFEVTLGTDMAKDPLAVNEDFDDANPDNIARLQRLADWLVNEKENAKLDEICRLLTQ